MNKFAVFAYGKEPEGGINDFIFDFKTKKQFEEKWYQFWVKLEESTKEELIVDIVDLENFEFESFTLVSNEWSITKTFDEIEDYIFNLFDGR